MPPLKFDPQATVEEIAGIGRHAAFDSVVDDKDDESIQVICKRGDDEIPLATRPAPSTSAITFSTPRKPIAPL